MRKSLSDGDERELAIVDGLAHQLRDHIRSNADEIARIHVFGAQSGVVQALFSRLLRDRLHFDEEVVLTPQDGLVTQARPDFFFRLPSGQGIIAEVERGGTTTNNHDLKDLWKAHVAPDAQHLFLMVPNSNFKSDGRAREKPFPIVARRLGAFFGDDRREIDVLSVHVFGY
ncbi:hypothetical protein [Nocardioides aurantiacus]|uniref:hypothetical protein n=1 Tax=Nocardioides aurantiacus TaxID=86796 RepID=UPI00403F8825